MYSWLCFNPYRGLSSTWPPGIHCSTSAILSTKPVPMVRVCAHKDTLINIFLLESTPVKSFCFLITRLRHVHIHQTICAVPQRESICLPRDGLRFHSSQERVCYSLLRPDTRVVFVLETYLLSCATRVQVRIGYTDTPVEPQANCNVCSS